MAVLGKRLTALHNAVVEPYHEVWDLCCDHGLLGMALIDSQRAQRVNFVDQLATVTEGLASQLKHYSAHACRIYTCAAEQLVFDASKKTLVIIAGVGGETVVDILQGLAQTNVMSHFDFLLSPANNNYVLRTYLREQGYGLKHELAVFERRRGYEVICVKKDEALPSISEVGAMWNIRHHQHRRHLEALIAHYRKRMNNPERREVAEQIAEKYTYILEGSCEG